MPQSLNTVRKKEKITLHVSAQALFDIMKKSLILETGEKKPDIRPGYSWSKKTGPRRTRVTITEWKEPAVYAARFVTDGKTLHVRYDLEPAGKDQVRVTYSHELEGTGFLVRRKEKAAVRQALTLLRNVETAILRQQESTDQVAS